MVWARRGLSWKQKHFTLSPSSASVAEAAPPARPDPTTMTEYLRLFAGFTSFISNLRLSQAVSIGPDGSLEFNCICAQEPNPALTAIGIEINPRTIRMEKTLA